MGSATALSFMVWLCISSQRALTTGELKYDTKEVSTSGCTYHYIANEAMSMLAVNETAQIIPAEESSTGFQIHHISYIWFTFIGCAICIIVALITSYITGPNNPAEMDQNLLAPFVRRIIKARSKKADKSANREKHFNESVL